MKVAQSCPTLRPHGLYSPWNSSGQNNGVGSFFSSPGDLPNPGIKPRSPASQVDSLRPQFLSIKWAGYTKHCLKILPGLEMTRPLPVYMYAHVHRRAHTHVMVGWCNSPRRSEYCPCCGSPLSWVWLWEEQTSSKTTAVNMAPKELYLIPVS